MGLKFKKVDHLWISCGCFVDLGGDEQLIMLTSLLTAFVFTIIFFKKELSAFWWVNVPNREEEFLLIKMK